MQLFMMLIAMGLKFHSNISGPVGLGFMVFAQFRRPAFFCLSQENMLFLCKAVAHNMLFLSCRYNSECTEAFQEYPSEKAVLLLHKEV